MFICQVSPHPDVYTLFQNLSSGSGSALHDYLRSQGLAEEAVQNLLKRWETLAEVDSFQTSRDIHSEISKLRIHLPQIYTALGHLVHSTTPALYNLGIRSAAAMLGIFFSQSKKYIC